MTTFHIFSDNSANADRIAKELEANKFSYSTTVYKHKGEKLIKFTVTSNYMALKDMSILEDIRLKLGL